MRHYKKGRKLGTDASHTKAMKKSLVSALFLNDRIKTVEARAKEIRGDVDRVIGWAKRGDVHSRRLAIAALGDKDLVREIFEKVSQGMFVDRNGGYTRILKLGNRKGDNAPMVILELVTERPVGKKKADAKPAVGKKAAPRKATPVKADEAKAEEAEEPASETLEEAAEETEAEAEEAEASTEAEEAEEPAAEATEEAEEAAEPEPEPEAEAGEKPAEAEPEAKTEATESEADADGEKKPEDEK